MTSQETVDALGVVSSVLDMIAKGNEALQERIDAWQEQIRNATAEVHAAALADLAAVTGTTEPQPITEE